MTFSPLSSSVPREHTPTSWPPVDLRTTSGHGIVRPTTQRGKYAAWLFPRACGSGDTCVIIFADVRNNVVRRKFLGTGVRNVNIDLAGFSCAVFHVRPEEPIQHTCGDRSGRAHHAFHPAVARFKTRPSQVEQRNIAETVAILEKNVIRTLLEKRVQVSKQGSAALVCPANVDHVRLHALALLARRMTEEDRRGHDTQAVKVILRVINDDRGVIRRHPADIHDLCNSQLD